MVAAARILALLIFLAPLLAKADEASSEEKATVEALMKQKLETAEQIEKIQAVQDAISLAPEAPQEKPRDPKAYRPLKDEASKIIQASPPFQIVN